MSNAELACSYASLILADEGIEITVCIPSFIPLGPEDDDGISGRLGMSRVAKGDYMENSKVELVIWGSQHRT